MAIELFVYTAQALQLFAASLPEQGATALIYTPDACMLAHLGSDGRLIGSSGQPVQTSAVYEARVFHDAAELRWWNDPSPQRAHRTTILAESRHNGWASAGMTEVPFAKQIIDRLEQQYLLWGTGETRVEGLAVGWSALATPRIGRLDVPVGPIGARDRVVLRAIEYLAEYEDGNVGVAEERLQRLETYHA